LSLFLELIDACPFGCPERLLDREIDNGHATTTRMDKTKTSSPSSFALPLLDIDSQPMAS